jgi:hypothetical protein
MKSNTYFPHDANARHDERIIALRIKHGMKGYGIYFAIIERLRENADLTCLTEYPLIAFELHECVEDIKSVVEDFGLFSFTEDRTRFYSESLCRRMTEIKKVRDTKSAGGKKGMKTRWGRDTELPQADNTLITDGLQTDNTVITELPQADNTVITIKRKEKKGNKEKELSYESSKEKSAVAASPPSTAEAEVYKPSGKAVQCVGKSIAEREKDFRKEVGAYAGQYLPVMLEDFADYWTEHSPGKLRMRFEKQSVFDMSRRLKTWARKDFNSPQTPKSHGTSIDETLAAHINAGIARGRAATEDNR